MIPKTNNMTVLAHWMNETASELIQDVMAMHTANLLKAMKGLFEERDDALRKVEIARQALHGIANDGTAMQFRLVPGNQSSSFGSPSIPVWVNVEVFEQWWSKDVDYWSQEPRIG